MRLELSLRRRIELACLALAVILSAVFGMVLWVGVGVLEDRLLNDRMLRAADALVLQHIEHSTRNVPGDSQVYVGDEIPTALRSVQPGLHEIVLGDRVLHVLMRDEAGRRVAIVDDESDFERVEGLVWAALGVAVVLSIAIALLLGRTTALRVIRPVVELSDAVEGQRPLGELPEIGRHDEVGILARALSAHNERMRRFLLREQVFTGDVSHELRTPLTVVLGAAEVLQARLADRPDLASFALRIQRTVTEMADRVSALLLLSQAPEKLEQPRVELAPLLERELDRCRPLLAGKPVDMELRMNASPHVHGRPELVSMAFGNLVRNACEWTEAGFVRAVLAADHVLIEDSGPGIPSAIRAQVFDRFVHGDGESAGNGLGLAIVQRICEHLGWVVELDRPSLPGTRFVVRFAASDRVDAGRNAQAGLAARSADTALMLP